MPILVAGRACRKRSGLTLFELSPRALERLDELLESEDELIRLETAKAILVRHLGRPAIQADISLRGGGVDEHIAALAETAVVAPWNRSLLEVMK